MEASGRSSNHWGPAVDCHSSAGVTATRRPFLGDFDPRGGPMAPMVTALILINVEPARTAAVARILSEMPAVSEVYSVAGNYDLVAMVRVREHEALADLVAAQIREVKGITRTETLVAFRAYSRYDLESLFSLD